MNDNIRRIEGKYVIDTNGTEVWQRGWTEVLCCGTWMRCHSFTNTCDCGADYNMSGQQLAPRSQWGEETGESVDDILSVDYGYPDETPYDGE